MGFKHLYYPRCRAGEAALAAGVCLMLLQKILPVNPLQAPAGGWERTHQYIADGRLQNRRLASLSRRRAGVAVPVHVLSDYTDVTANKGLNNQLWTLAGAVADGCREQLSNPADLGKNITTSFPAVLLPRLIGDVPRFVGLKAAARQHHSAGELFDMEYLADTMVKGLGCLVTDRPTWQSMLNMGEILQVKGFISSGRSSAFDRMMAGLELDLLYKALMPSQRLMQLSLNRCQESLKAEFRSMPYLTIHMRIEDDWVEACQPIKIKNKNKLSPSKCRVPLAVPGPTLFNAGMISRSVRNTPGLTNYSSRIFMIYAADRVNTKKTVRMYGLQADPMHVWPRDSKATQTQKLRCFHGIRTTYTERSVVNFFMAALAEGPMVGTPRSTFSMGVFLFRRWRSKPSYLYQCESNSQQVIPFSEVPTQQDPTWLPTTGLFLC